MRPRGRCRRRLEGGGICRLGLCVLLFFFLSGFLPSLLRPRGSGEGGAAASGVSDPPRPGPLSALTATPLGRRWLLRPGRWEGDGASAAPHPRCPPRPFLLRLDAPPRPQPPGPTALTGAEWPDRVEPTQLYCSTRDTSSPPARLSSGLIKFPAWGRGGSQALPAWGRGGRAGSCRNRPPSSDCLRDRGATRSPPDGAGVGRAPTHPFLARGGGWAGWAGAWV